MMLGSMLLMLEGQWRTRVPSGTTYQVGRAQCAYIAPAKQNVDAVISIVMRREAFSPNAFVQKKMVVTSPVALDAFSVPTLSAIQSVTHGIPNSPVAADAFSITTLSVTPATYDISLKDTMREAFEVRRCHVRLPTC